MPFNKQKAEQILDMIAKVPAGKVASYGLIADLAGLPGRARLVGSVMKQAPTEMQLPSYRILRSNGQIAFKPGSQMSRKQIELLQAEGVLVIKNRVNLKQFLWQPDLGELLRFEY